MSTAHNILNREENQRIVDTIKQAELNTSGEIKGHIEKVWKQVFCTAAKSRRLISLIKTTTSIKSVTKYHTEIDGNARLRGYEFAKMRERETMRTRGNGITRWLLVCLLLVLYGTIMAQIPSKPYPPRLVNDFTNTLSYSETETLEQRLVAYNDSTSTQITVVLVDDLHGMDVAQFATRLGHEWGVGQGAKDNGAVILVKPKNEKGNGQVNISPGYGLEPYITDAAASAIIQKEMIPYFKENNYYQGIYNAVTVMMDLCSGKFTADEYANGNGSGSIIALIIIIIIIILIIKSSGSTTYTGSGSSGRVIIIPGPGSFGGGHSGGFGGGGFSGFGGGHFGGGGASGSW